MSWWSGSLRGVQVHRPAQGSRDFGDRLPPELRPVLAVPPVLTRHLHLLKKLLGMVTSVTVRFECTAVP